MNARHLLAVKRYDEAIEAAARAIREAPEHAEPRYVYSVACNAGGKIGHALTPAQNAVQVEPFNSRYVAHLASVYSELDEHRKAFDTFDNALELDPTSPETHILHVEAVARALRTGGYVRTSKMTDRASSSVDTLLQLHPEESVSHATNARYLLLVNQPQEAAWAAHRALEIDPNEASSYQLLGLAFQGVGDKQKAGDAFVMAGKLDPSSSRSGDLLASLAKGSMPPIAFGCWVLLRLARAANRGQDSFGSQPTAGPDPNMPAILIVGVILTIACIGIAVWMHRNKPAKPSGPKHLSPQARQVLAARKELRG